MYSMQMSIKYMRNGLPVEHRLDQAWQGYDMENRKIIESIQCTTVSFPLLLIIALWGIQDFVGDINRVNL